MRAIASNLCRPANSIAQTSAELGRRINAKAAYKPVDLGNIQRISSNAKPRRTPRRRSIVNRLMWRTIARNSGFGQARGLLRIWIAWERISNHLWPTQPVPRAAFGLFRVRLIRYRGERLLLPDETVISPGDTVCELHCDNQAIVALLRTRNSNCLSACRYDLECLARWLNETAESLQIKALYGVTILWLAAARLGFTVRDRGRGIRNRLDRIFMGGLLLVYSPNRSGRINRGETLDQYPYEVWFSRDQLINQYLEQVQWKHSFSTSNAEMTLERTSA